MQKRSYVVSVGASNPKSVDLVFDLGVGAWVAEVDGERLTIDLKADRQGAMTATVDGREVPLTVARGADGHTRLGLSTSKGGAALPVRVRSAGEIALTRPSKRPEAPKAQPQVSCPITGMVLQVPVRAGERVKQGQPLVMLESMKMETWINSPRDGRIRRVHASVGQAVRRGGALLELDD